MACSETIRTDVARLSPGAIRIITEACQAAPGVETGGILLSSQNPRYWVIEGVEGPGPAAVLAPRALSWDLSYIVGLLVGLDYSDTKPIGRWHKHCAPILHASAEDKAGAEAFRRALGMDSMVDVIVACDRDVPIGWAAYQCSESGYYRVDVEIPTFESL